MPARGPLLLFSAVTFVACGASPAPPPSAPSTATPPLPDEDRCLASIAHGRVPGWTEHGKIVVALEDGQPRSLQAIDGAGTVTTTRPAPPSKEDARAALRELTCALGGVIATLEGDEPPTTGPGTATFTVLVPQVVSEKADVAALCRRPEEAADGQKPRLTFDQLERRLTSRRWRAWLFDLVDEHERTSGSDRMMLHWRRADELAEAARVAGQAGQAGTCWFEVQLRSPGG